MKSRLIAGIAKSDDNTWFFKMTGEANAVAKEAPSFTKLLGSLHAGTP